ncbi:hypothetical protein SLA2020_398930 [Shorea laevis]
MGKMWIRYWCKSSLSPLQKTPLNYDDIGESRRKIPNADYARAKKDSELDDELHSFLPDMDSDSGVVQEWMRGREWKKSRKRCRKAKSCIEVYRESKVISTILRSRRGRTRKSTTAEASQLEFMANSDNEVADDSINDSNINNCYNRILKKMKVFGAREI